MNRHLKRGLVASSIIFTLVAITGAMDIYFDPPVDVPSVGYYAPSWLVKAVIALSVSAGFSMFFLVALGSVIVGNASKGWVLILSYIIKR